MAEVKQEKPGAAEVVRQNVAIISYWHYPAMLCVFLGMFSALSRFDSLAGGVLFALTVIFFSLAFRKKKSIELIQSIATLSGIGLTFIGLVISLTGLDLSNFGEIHNSLLGILSGIYPAFFSSIAGVFVAITTNVFPDFWKLSDEHEAESTDTDTQILRELKKINESFEEFSGKITEMNTKALEKVIEEFNTKLQDQFGENFKKLNEAVFKLVEWQEGYKDLVIESQEKLKQTQKILDKSLKAIDQVSATMSDMNDQVSIFQEASTNLKDNLAELDKGIKDNTEIAESLAQLAAQMENVPDSIKKSMEKVTLQTIQELGQNLKGISEALVNDYEKVHDAIKKIK